MQSLAKLLILAGAVLLVTWMIVLGVLHFTGGRGLPGDLVFRRGNFVFYLPLATCVVLSLILTIALYLFGVLRR